MAYSRKVRRNGKNISVKLNQSECISQISELCADLVAALISGSTQEIWLDASATEAIDLTFVQVVKAASLSAGRHRKTFGIRGLSDSLTKTLTEAGISLS